MSRFPFIKQKDSMQCGVACLAMMAALHGRRYSLAALGRYCHATTEGVSMLGISQGAQAIGMETAAARVTSDQLARLGKPCIVHWNQNHFVVLHKVSRRGRFLVADPGKGMVKYSRSEFESHWLSTVSGGEDKGIALFMEPKPEFFTRHEDATSEKRSFRFLAGYIRQYRKYFTQILLGLMLGCVLQLILPFLTQSIVDIGIRHSDVGFIWLVLLGELMIVTGRTATDFIRRWLLLHISMRINISLVSDFFIKLLKLPMSFFDTKLMGDLLQRMNDHSRVQSFLTSQVLGIVFTSFSFVVFGVVLYVYDRLIFAVFIAGSVLYGAWIAVFLRRRKVHNPRQHHIPLRPPFPCQHDRRSDGAYTRRKGHRHSGSVRKRKNHTDKAHARVLSRGERRYNHRRTQHQRLQPQVVAQTLRSGDAGRSDILRVHSPQHRGERRRHRRGAAGERRKDSLHT